MMDNILCVENLNYSYHDKLVFTNLTFSVKQNSINAVIGPNNCGKTTLIKLLCGNLQTQNSISVDGVTLNSNNMCSYSSFIGYNRIILNSRNMSMKVYDLLASLKIDGILKKDLLNRINYLLEFFDVSSFIKRRITACFYSIQKDLNSFFFYMCSRMGWEDKSTKTYF